MLLQSFWLIGANGDNGFMPGWKASCPKEVGSASVSVDRFPLNCCFCLAVFSWQDNISSAGSLYDVCPGGLSKGT